MSIRIPTGPVTPSAEEKKLHNASGHALDRRWCRWCAAARTADEPHQKQTKPRQELSLTQQSSNERMIKHCQRLLSTRLMTDQRAQQQRLCSTKTFSEYLTETTVACVEVLGHKCGDATLRPRTCLGAVAENCTEQTSDRNVGETWSKNQSSEPEQD